MLELFVVFINGQFVDCVYNAFTKLVHIAPEFWSVLCYTCHSQKHETLIQCCFTVGQRLRRRSSLRPTLCKCLVFDGRRTVYSHLLLDNRWLNVGSTSVTPVQCWSSLFKYCVSCVVDSPGSSCVQRGASTLSTLSELHTQRWPITLTMLPPNDMHPSKNQRSANSNLERIYNFITYMHTFTISYKKLYMNVILYGYVILNYFF